MEQIKQQARDELAQLEAERRSLQTEWVERQKKRIADLERNFQDTQKRLEAEISRLAEEIRDRTLRAQIEKQSGKRVAKIGADARADANAAVVETLAASQEDLGVSPSVAGKPVAPERLSTGQRITVKNFKQPVVFRRHDGRMAEIEAGPLRMRVPLSDIIAVEADKSRTARPESAAGAQRHGITVHAQSSDEPVADEINVIGCTVEEATRRVDKFIDEAALAGKPSVRVIHGHGMGALRRGLGEFLSTHPLVESIRHETEDRGGAAITIAELRG